ncbi:MAG: HD domain-containing phosphohydrolase [Actinomycetota bacterium]
MNMDSHLRAPGTQAPQDARILVVDDQPANIRLLERVLTRDGFEHVACTTSPEESLDLYQEFRPDLVLLDLHMPEMDGFEVLERLRELSYAEVYLPVVILTADITPEARRQALSMGAKDFLTKPFDAAEVLLRIRNLLETRRLHQRLSDQNRLLEDRVVERTRQLDEARLEILERLAVAAEYRDDDTGEHVHRVARISAMLAHVLGLSLQEVELVRRASTLHDLGKIGISDTILLKPGKLTAEEFDVIKRHPTIGAQILSGSESPLLQYAEEICLTHHERWDGSGYPRSMAGDEIPISGRIVTVADVFDALTHDRPYKRAWKVADAVEEIDRQRGRQFDPAVVDAFGDVLERWSDGTFDVA